MKKLVILSVMFMGTVGYILSSQSPARINEISIDIPMSVGISTNTHCAQKDAIGKCIKWEPDNIVIN